MRDYKCRFIEFMVECGVLTFGDFITKSGRPTPYFINTGNFDSGWRLARLGGFYAEAIYSHLGGEFDCLFGPAYKGIPLAAAAAMALAENYNLDVKVSFNRKEIKDHGEGGALLCWQPRPGERVVIIEDVTTAGTSVRETAPLLRREDSVEITALVVAVDRQEKGPRGDSALNELAGEYGLRPIPIVTLDEIIEYLHGREIQGRIVIDETVAAKINDYRARYGAGGAT